MRAMSSARIAYVPRPDATPKGEIAVLADIYAFVLKCGEARRAEEKRKGGAPNTADDAKEIKDEVHATARIPR